MILLGSDKQISQNMTFQSCKNAALYKFTYKRDTNMVSVSVVPFTKGSTINCPQYNLTVVDFLLEL